MDSRSERAQQWWILSPEDDGPDSDLGQLVAAVRERDWAVFSGDPIAPKVPPVALALAESADGRKICVGLIVGLNEAYPAGDGKRSMGMPVEVTSRALRGIPVAELIGRAVFDDQAPERHAGFRRLVESRMPTTPDARRTPGPKGWPDEHFRQIADQYRAALECAPEAPLNWLSQQWPEYHRSTVARWVQRARDKGYLGSTDPGRAGDKRGTE